MHVVEGLEEELFTSEARRNDAEVTWHPSYFAVEWGYSISCAVLAVISVQAEPLFKATLHKYCPLV